MMQTAGRFAFVALCLVLGACSSERFRGPSRGPVAQAYPAPLPAPDQAPVEAVPSGPVVAAPLPPLEDTAGTGAGSANPSEVAALPPPVVAPSASPTPSGRSTLVGGWTAQVTGTNCRVQLSSTPTLDLYRASSSGCANADLAKINAWDYRDGEVYLYQTGGTVAARLRGGASGLSGVLARSGAPLSLNR